jgi:dTDP-4-amino-4,6-dideoxygalactose transaminase
VRTPPPAAKGSRHIYNQYCIRVERRDELRAWLGKHEVGAEIYYPLALHMQQCCAYLGHKPEDFPESLRATQESLALPIYPELAESQLQYVVDTVTSLFRQQYPDSQRFEPRNCCGGSRFSSQRLGFRGRTQSNAWVFCV